MCAKYLKVLLYAQTYLLPSKTRPTNNSMSEDEHRIIRIME